MIRVHLNGEKQDLADGSTLGSLLEGHPEKYCVAVIRPATKEQAQTGIM